MFRRRLRARCSAVLSLLVCGVTAFLAGPASADDPKSPQMVQYESLAKEYVQMRDVQALQLGPQDLLQVAELLEGRIQKLIDESAGDPSAKSKGLELLALTYSFDGKSPEAKKAYSDFLDVLESWQGKDYAVMTVRRAGGRMLAQEGRPAKALEYYDLLLEKYPDHASKAHVLYQSGLACLETKAFAEAVRRFDAALATEPEGYYAPWALRNKAGALADMEPVGSDCAASLAVLDELGRRFPNPHWGGYACYRRGVLLEYAQKPLEALVEYQRGISDYPTSPYAIWSDQAAKRVQEDIQKKLLDKMARTKPPPEKPAAPVPAVVGDLVMKEGSR